MAWYVAAAAFIAAGYAFGWIEKGVLVAPSILAGLVCVVAANLYRIKSFKAGIEGTSIEEARVAVQESRQLAFVISSRTRGGLCLLPSASPASSPRRVE
jgi:hypothetical protein